MMFAHGNLCVESVKLKEKLITFLQNHELLSDVEKNCVYLLKKWNRIQLKGKIFEPFISNLKLRYSNFNDTEEGKISDDHGFKLHQVTQYRLFFI